MLTVVGFPCIYCYMYRNFSELQMSFGFAYRSYAAIFEYRYPYPFEIVDREIVVSHY